MIENCEVTTLLLLSNEMKTLTLIDHF